MKHIITHMKLLVIIATHKMNYRLRGNIIKLDFLLREEGHIVDYAGISSVDDFAIYEDIIQFKYKEVNPKYQLTKVCNFIEKNKATFVYDWFIKFRPEIHLVKLFDFNTLNPMCINARVRMYTGPKSIPYGMSIELPTILSETESFVEMDDQIYIFHKNLIDAGGFSQIEAYNNILHIEHEPVHTAFWNERGIPFNIISINALFMRDPCVISFNSGHINYPLTQ